MEHAQQSSARAALVCFPALCLILSSSLIPLAASKHAKRTPRASLKFLLSLWAAVFTLHCLSLAAHVSQCLLTVEPAPAPISKTGVIHLRPPSSAAASYSPPSHCILRRMKAWHLEWQTASSPSPSPNPYTGLLFTPLLTYHSPCTWMLSDTARSLPMGLG